MKFPRGCRWRVRRSCKALIIVLLGPRLAQEIFPSSASTQFRLRIDAPDGTRVAVTEALVQKVLAAIAREAGAGNLELTLGYIGTQPSSYPINTVLLWTSGPQQAIMNVGLKAGAKISLHSLEEKLRQKLPEEFPGTHFSFDPGDLIGQTLNFGAPSSAEVAITGTAVCGRPERMPIAFGKNWRK